jgi:hypothetical protein
VLHLRPRGARLHPVDKLPEAFEAFLALKKVFEWNAYIAPQTIVQVAKVN